MDVLSSASEDWQMVRLGTVGSFGKGAGIKKDETRSGLLPAVRYGELYTDHKEIIKSHKSFISEKVASGAALLKQGDILFAGSGETKEDIGKCSGFFGDYAAYAGGDIIIFRPTKADARYLSYALNSFPINLQKAQRAQGDAVVHIYANALADIELPLPPVAEQAIIAEALSDADGVVEGLERLIAKKRRIKQGAMQDLLTAKRRLPGFSGEWVERQLGEILTVRHGRSQKDVESPNGIYPILATGGQIGFSNAFLWDKPSVLIGRKGTIDRPQFMDTPFWTVDTLFYTDIKNPNDARFLFGVFQLIDWSSYNEASGVPSLNASTIEAIEVLMPDDDEQRAIAEVLNDMDAEITVLETRLKKARQIKEGMMQNLLTGRIRLV